MQQKMKLFAAMVLLLGAVTSDTDIWEGKKYINYESENLNEFLKELDVGWFLRFVAYLDEPIISLIALPDNQYKLLTESTFKSNRIVFELGKEFGDETLDGRKVKSVVTFEGNTMTHKQGGIPPVTIVRQFGEKELNVTMRVYDVVCTLWYRTKK